MSERPKSREYVRTIERLTALAEAYGAADVEGLRADIEVIIKVEYLTHEREVRSVEERWRRRMHRGAKAPNQG